MQDKYIITTNQQGQPQNLKSPVGPSNVATGEDPNKDEFLHQGPEEIPEHVHVPPKTPGTVKDTSNRPMKEKIGKK